MTICVTQDANGYLQTTTESLSDCTGWALLEPSEYASIVQPIDFALMGITPENILYFYTWGAGAVLMLWALGFALNAAIKTINKA